MGIPQGRLSLMEEPSMLRRRNTDTRAATAGKILAKQKRWAAELREAGWIVIEKDSKEHICDSCSEKATHCYRDGRGTGHSEHICACKNHAE